MAAALRFSDLAREDRLRKRLALADLSCLPRLGLKGAGVLAWLLENGLQTAGALYAVTPIEDDGILVRIDREEVILEDGIRGQAVSRIRNRLSANPPGVYRVPGRRCSLPDLRPRFSGIGGTGGPEPGGRSLLPTASSGGIRHRRASDLAGPEL